MENYGKITVLAGGPSGERDISLKSGSAVYNALKSRNYDVSLVHIDRNLNLSLNKLKDSVVFLALHGEYGEDGTIQALLEEMGIPYTGSGVKASRLAMDKIESRRIFLENGLKVPSFKVVTRRTKISDITREVSMPFVIKPRSSGSSLGLSIVRNRHEITKALKEAFRYGDTVIAEKYIYGREFTVGILENIPLPVIEIAAKANVYDYDAKYMDEATRYILSVRLDESYYRIIQESALKSHRILGCRDFSRVDMRMDNAGDVYILELNTIPGMTERSLLPKAVGACGMSFADLCTKLVDLAYKRKEPRAWQEISPLRKETRKASPKKEPL